jgi:hypothetical protein
MVKQFLPHLVFAIVLIIGGLAILSSFDNGISPVKGVHSLFARYRLLPETEQMTELYFNNHLELKSRLEPSKIATASFTIANHELQTNSYEYIIRVTHQSRTTNLASGSAVIPAQTSQQFSFSYQVATAEPETIFEVVLPELDQNVYFIVNSNSKRNEEKNN